MLHFTLHCLNVFIFKKYTVYMSVYTSGDNSFVFVVVLF